MRQENKSEQEDEVIIYSDGSKLKQGCGVGVYRKSWGGVQKIAKGYRLGKKLEIMDVEMIGIKKAMEEGIAECEREGKRKLTICVDNQEAMRRVRKREASSGEMMAYEIRWLCDAAKQREIQVKFEWVKGHAKINGNEKADLLAKHHATRGTIDQDNFTSFAWLETSSKMQAFQDWEEEFTSNPKKGKSYVGSPKRRHKVKFHPSERIDKVLASCLRTGHIITNAYLHRIGKKESPECNCGDGATQTVHHILFECGWIHEARHTLQENLQERLCPAMLDTQEGIEGLMKLWKEWQKEQKEIEHIQEAEDIELSWGIGGLEM